MASGAKHDKLILYSVPIAAGLCLAAGAPDQVIIFTASHLLGGLFLSPDLDIASSPYRRWGVLKAFWLPYQKLARHRGMSHWIFVGTAGRVLYLAVPIVITLLLSGVTPASLLAWGTAFARPILFCLLGLEFSALIHLQADGILFGKKKRKRKRR